MDANDALMSPTVRSAAGGTDFPFREVIEQGGQGRDRSQLTDFVPRRRDRVSEDIRRELKLKRERKLAAQA
jgi:hypothetical protein